MFSSKTGGFGDMVSILVAGDSVWVLVVTNVSVGVMRRSVWVGIDVVVTSDASVWVPTSSRMVVAMKQRSLWPAVVQSLCSSYSPIAIPSL